MEIHLLGRSRARYGLRGAAGLVISVALSGVLWAPTSAAGPAGNTLASGDFNGDGWEDLAIGAPFDDVQGRAAAGVVNVIYGTSAGLASGGDQVWTQDRIAAGVSVAGDVTIGSEVGDHFGWALAAADFDDDGFGDLAVSAPDEDYIGDPVFRSRPAGGDWTNSGVVHVILGSALGLTAQGAKVARNEANGARFGFALAVLDAYKGTGGPGTDGGPDLAISAPGADAGAGEVSLFYGNRLGLDSPSGGLLLLFDGENDGQPGARAGTSLAGGRFDSTDGDDLAIGAPRYDTQFDSDTGGIYVVYNGVPQPGALTEFTMNEDADPEPGDHIGASLAAGLLDRCPGRDSLVIGVPGEDIGGTANAGAVFIVSPVAGGFHAGSSAEFLTQESLGVPGASGTGDRFGAAVLVGDLGSPPVSATRQRQASPAGCLPVADIVVGVPGDMVSGRDEAGTVVALYFSGGTRRTSGNQRWHQDSSGILGVAESGDQSGTTLGAGRFGPGESLSLVAGIPREDVGSVRDAGAIAVVRSEAGGLVAAGDQVWDQGIQGIGEVPQPGDRFGSGLPSFH